MLTARWREAAAVATGLAVTFGLLVAPATGAETGDNGLARFHRQRVDWHSCQQGPRDADGQALDQAGAQCAEVAVPLDYRHPDRQVVDADQGAHRVHTRRGSTGNKQTRAAGDGSAATLDCPPICQRERPRLPAGRLPSVPSLQPSTQVGLVAPK